MHEYLFCNLLTNVKKLKLLPEINIINYINYIWDIIMLLFKTMFV